MDAHRARPLHLGVIGATLPTAARNHRGMLRFQDGGAATDEVYVGVREAGGGFDWRRIGRDHPTFDLRDFQAVNDGTTDDRVAILAAIAAASATGGGTVVGPGSYGFTGVIDVPSGVNIWGEGSGKAANGTRLVALNAAAQLKFGNATTAQYGGLSGNFLIDGNSLATDPLYIGIVNGRHFDSLFIANAAAGGAAMRIVLTQNSLYSNTNIETCAGDGLVFDSGCANNDFEGLRIADVEGIAVKFVSTVAPPAGFVNYPTYNRVRGFMIEHFTNGSDGLVYHGVGSENAFSGGVFALAAVTSARTIVTMALDDVGKPSSHLHFEDVSWIGVQAHVTAISAGAGNSCLLDGVHTFGAILRALFLAAGAAVHNHASVTLNAVTSWFVANGGGITEDAAIRTYARSPLEIDRATAGDTAIQVKNGGSSRLVVDNNGVLTWQGDTVLRRLAANSLGTDDQLVVSRDADGALVVQQADGDLVLVVNTNGKIVGLFNGASLVLYADALAADVKGVWDGTTGTLSIRDGGDIVLYSDDGATEQVRIDGADGDITTTGEVVVTKDAAGALTVEKADGTDQFNVNTTTGVVDLPNGVDFKMTSDAYTTQKFLVDGADGTVYLANGTQIRNGAGDPNGVVTAPRGSSFHSTNGNIYRNTDDGTTWVAT